MNIGEELSPLRGLSPYVEINIALPSEPESYVCWREHILCVVPLMPYRSKGKCRTKFNPALPSWGFGVGLTTPLGKKVIVARPPEPMEGDNTHTGL
jgi:hypothetical protein